MPEIFSNPTLILGITTPITLIAFFISVYYGYKFKKAESDVEKLQTVPENKRAELIKSLSIDYPDIVKLNSLSGEQKYNLVLEQIRNKERERHRRFLLTLIISVLLLIVVLVYVFKPPIATDGYKDLHGEKVQIVNASQIENKLANVIDTRQTNSIEKSFLDLYYSANEQIVSSLKQVSDTAREVMFISGVAGYGKTTFIDDVCNKILKDYVKVNLTDLNKQTKIFAEDKIDLQFEDSKTGDEMIINRLPNLDYSKFEIASLFKPEELKKKYLIFDDVDEVHPDLAQAVIQKAFNFINNSKESKVFILIGRPEVFNESMRMPDFRKNYSKQFHIFQLQPIKYKSFAQVKLRIENYNDREDKQWSNADIDYRTQQISSYINENKFLSYSFSNLSLCNIIISTFENAINTPDTIKNILFADLLYRANKKHFRPSFEKPTYLQEYIDALCFTAAKYSKLDTAGFFNVLPTDVINFSTTETKKDFSVNVSTLLNRSGLVTLQPFNDKGMHYRFEPFWVQQYLIDLYNRKCKK